MTDPWSRKWGVLYTVVLFIIDKLKKRDKNITIVIDNFIPKSIHTKIDAGNKTYTYAGQKRGDGYYLYKSDDGDSVWSPPNIAEIK